MVRLALLCGLAICACAAPDKEVEVTYENALTLKTAQLRKAAANAVVQQRKTSLPAQPLTVTAKAVGTAAVTVTKGWDKDGDGTAFTITAKNITVDNTDKRRIRKNGVRFQLAQPTDFFSKATGITFWVNAPDGLSPNLRMGLQAYAQGEAEPLVTLPDVGVVHKFGDNPHKVYYDLAGLRKEKGTRRDTYTDLLKKITALEVVFNQKELPGKTKGLKPVTGTFALDALALEDIYDGSYNSDRFPADGAMNARMDPGSRYQQVTRVVAECGGPEGLKSAVRSMDFMARLQAFDGSWPAGSALQGETTWGMIVKDMSYALAAMRKAGMPELQETVTAQHHTMPRGKLYEQMLFRAVTARGPEIIDKWFDSHYHGQGALLNGANRPMVYILSMWTTAQVLTDPAMKKEALRQYNQNMDMLLTYQGRESGGWPIYGESNKRGQKQYGKDVIHYDAPYTMDHFQIMAYGTRCTGDKRWAEMMHKYDTVVPALVRTDGIHWDFGLSERHPTERRLTTMKIPDIVFQEAVKAGAPNIAQWAANCSAADWKNWPVKMWKAAGTVKGYPLGAFTAALINDLQQDPAPADQGIVFPRQMNIYTVRWTDKYTGKVVRTSGSLVGTDGAVQNDVTWKPGQYPALTGLPLVITPSSSVRVTALAYNGKGLPGQQSGKGVVAGGKEFTVTDGAATVEITGSADITITAGTAEMTFRVAPEQKGAAVTLALRFQETVDRTPLVKKVPPGKKQRSGGKK